MVGIPTDNKPLITPDIISLLLRILDSTHQALIVHVMYYYLVQNYLNARALLDTVWYVFVPGLHHASTR